MCKSRSQVNDNKIEHMIPPKSAFPLLYSTPCNIIKRPNGCSYNQRAHIPNPAPLTPLIELSHINSLPQQSCLSLEHSGPPIHLWQVFHRQGGKKLAEFQFVFLDSPAQRVDYAKKSGQLLGGIMGRTRAIVQYFGVDITQQASNCNEQIFSVLSRRTVWTVRWCEESNVCEQIVWDNELWVEMGKLKICFLILYIDRHPTRKTSASPS